MFKGQAAISKYKYWDSPMLLTSEDNQPLGTQSFVSRDYCLNLTFTAHYFVGEKFSIGSGVGAQVLLASHTKPRDGEFFQGDVRGTPNKHYKPVMPVIPIEFSMHREKFYYTFRYEQALLNRIRGDLSRVHSETYGLLVLEIGRKIR